MCGLLLVGSSCGTYTGSGAMLGASFGSTIGSAIGGISNGPYGSDVGTLIGLAGGALVGAGIGNAIDNANQKKMEQQYADQYTQPQYTGPQYSQPQYSQPQYQPETQNYTTMYAQPQSVIQPTVLLPTQCAIAGELSGYNLTSELEIRNARLIDSNADGGISRGEECKVSFELFNVGAQPVYNIWPSVVNASSNSHIAISPGVRVEQILPGKGIRYTALVKADNSLGNGSLTICVAAVVPDIHTISLVYQFTIPTYH